MPGVLLSGGRPAIRIPSTSLGNFHGSACPVTDTENLNIRNSAGACTRERDTATDEAISDRTWPIIEYAAEVLVMGHQQR